MSSIIPSSLHRVVSPPVVKELTQFNVKFATFTRDYTCVTSIGEHSTQESKPIASSATGGSGEMKIKFHLEEILLHNGNTLFPKRLPFVLTGNIIVSREAKSF